MLKFLSRVRIEFNALDPRTAACMEFLAQCNARQAKESNPACQLLVKRRTDDFPPQITVTFVNGIEEVFDATSTPAQTIRNMILEKGQLLETEQMFRDAGEKWPVVIPEEELSLPAPGTKSFILEIHCLLQIPPSKWAINEIYSQFLSIPMDPKEGDGSKSRNAPSQSSSVECKWGKPPPGFFKVNVDAAFKSLEWASVGVIIRDSKGSLVTSFSKKIIATSPLMAEAVACKEGLKLARVWGFSSVIIESDCKNLISSLGGGGAPDVEILAVFHDCKTLAASFDQCIFMHVNRQANRPAHWVASKCLANSLARVPEALASLLAVDLV